jgi:hypothetical protein
VVVPKVTAALRHAANAERLRAALERARRGKYVKVADQGLALGYAPDLMAAPMVEVIREALARAEAKADPFGRKPGRTVTADRRHVGGGWWVGPPPKPRTRVVEFSTRPTYAGDQEVIWRVLPATSTNQIKEAGRA